MKIFTLKSNTCLFLSGWWMVSASAAMFLQENFNYAPGTLTGQSGGSGWSAAWVTSAGATSTVVGLGGSSYPGLPSTGKAITKSNNASQGNTRSWSGSGLFTHGSALWFSVLVQTTIPASDLRFYVLSAVDPASGGTGFRINGSLINATIGNIASSASLYVIPGAPMLLVGKLQF